MHVQYKTFNLGGFVSKVDANGVQARQDTFITQKYKVNDGKWYDGPSTPKALTGATLIQDGDDILLLGGFDNTDIYKFTGTGWRRLSAPQFQDGDRAYASILTVPDSALRNCRNVKADSN